MTLLIYFTKNNPKKTAKTPNIIEPIIYIAKLK